MRHSEMPRVARGQHAVCISAYQDSRNRRCLPALVLLALVCLAANGEHAPTSSIRIQIESPKPHEPVRNKTHQAQLRGSAVSLGDNPLTADLDVLIVIDVSDSTKNASGVDVDQDGEIGINPDFELVPPGTYAPGTYCTDPDDTILAAEVAAADALISSLDPARVRVGILSFSGEMNPTNGHRAKLDQRDARVEIPLTRDPSIARRGLDQILSRGPHGGTNSAAGVLLAVTELAALSGAKSAAREGAKKIVLFLTDGLPTFPIGSAKQSDPGDVEALLRAARLAHEAGITIHSYALGHYAITEPFAVTELARITAGRFTAVLNPGEVIGYLQGISFADIDDVVFTNLTTKEASEDVSLFPDGNFSGVISVREGVNRVRITALATNGTRASVDFDLEFEESTLNDRELAIELERIRRRNRELQLLIEGERIQRFRAEQRKSLKIEAEQPETNTLN